MKNILYIGLDVDDKAFSRGRVYVKKAGKSLSFLPSEQSRFAEKAA